MPATWPWPFDVWLALLVGGWLVPGLWRWLQRRRATGWPLADGRIESTEVAQLALTRTRGYHVARLRYSYSVFGNAYSGVYKREFPTEFEARNFLRDLEGKAVSVRYSPTRLSRSFVLNRDIETVLLNRPPANDEEPAPGTVIPAWMRPVTWFSVWLSALGLVISLGVHIRALMRHTFPSPLPFWALSTGIFVVWIPAILIARRRVGNVNRRDFWKVVLRESPDWMRYIVFGSIGYAVINFAIFMGHPPADGSGTNPPADVWRGFSGLWMAFYSVALAILYSAASAANSGLRCVNGHLAPLGALVCTKCDQPVGANR